MAREQYHVTRGLVWTALLVLCACFGVGLCHSPRRYGSPDVLSLSQHMRMVQSEALCKFPRQRTVCVQDIYPDDRKLYTPHCTLLHRCGPDTGCCAHPEEHCRPKTTEVVVRQFLVHSLVEGEQGTTEEDLFFNNHTECECRAKYDHTR